MNIPVCATCGRFLKFVEYTADEAKEINAPDGAGYMSCKKCGPQSAWETVERKSKRNPPAALSRERMEDEK